MRRFGFYQNTDIKADFQLSDTQMGFLTGLGFTLFYVLAGIPIARLADKYSRKKLLSYALGIWSFTTALCGLAQSFVQLVIIRTLVGVGEAGASPPSYSLISDLYPARKRATAMSIYLAGSPLGLMLGFILGGWLTEHHGWRFALIAVGLPGVLFAVVLAKFLVEPRRGQQDEQPAPTTELSLKTVLTGLLRKRTFWHTALGTSFYNTVGVVYVAWLPSFFVRSHEMGTGQTGLMLALFMGPAQILGVIAGGYCADLLGRRDVRWYLHLPAAMILLSMPFYMLSLFLTSTTLALVCLAIPLFIGGMQTSPPFAITHSLVEARARAVASAVLIVIINIISGGVGPILVGYISDQLAPTQGIHSLKYALLIVTPVLCVWAVAHNLLAARHIRADMNLRGLS